MISTTNVPSKAIRTARLIGWIVASLVTAVALGWLAAEVSATWAPLVIFPMLLGGALGAMLVVLMRICQIHSGWIVYPIAILAVALVVTSQHWFVYREATQAVLQDIRLLRKASTLLPDDFQGEITTLPANFFEYLQNEADQPRKITIWYEEATLQGIRTWLFWGLNTTIILLLVMMVLYQGRTRSWCPTCRTWYQTTRRGHLDRATTEALLVVSQTTDSDQKPDEGAEQAIVSKKGRYASFILSDCDGRCGRTEFRLFRAAGANVETYHLNRDQRHEVETILDKNQ